MRLPRFLDLRLTAANDGVIDLRDPEFFANPYPTYERLRRQAPVHISSTGAHLFVRHASVKAAMTNSDLGNAPSRFSGLAARFAATRIAASVAANIPPFQDRPQHIVTRRALSAAFARRFSDVSGDLEEIATDYAAKLPRECDIIADMSAPYAVSVMQKFTGLDDLTQGTLASGSSIFFELFAPLTTAAQLAKVNSGLMQVRDAIRPVVANRRSSPRRDFISYLIEADADENAFGDDQIADLTLLILADGIENIRAAAASALILLDQKARVAMAEGHRASVVEEVLRLETPGQIIPRVVRRDTEIDGVLLKADKPVLLALASANRDGAVFDRPDAFDPARDHSDVQTFGRGRHSCIGAPLARSMIAAITSALVARDAQVRDATKVRFQHRFGHRWPAAVEIRVS